MCVVSLDVDTISSTQILVAYDPSTARQLTVYSNLVDTDEEENAMILAVPNPESIVLHNLVNYQDIFEDCESMTVLRHMSDMRSGYADDTFDNDFDNDSLDVYDVGSYNVSIAINLNDVNRVNTNVFRLSDGCRAFLNSTYSRFDNVGFVICQLKTGNHYYHPIAYSHAVTNNKMFIPTVHYHQHSSRQFTRGHNRNGGNDWDHTIYVANGNIPSELNVKDETNLKWKWTGENRLNRTAVPNYVFPPLRSFYRFDIDKNNGMFLPNVDMTSVVVI